MSKDYYKILGVAEFDSAENIKNAYRKLARKWHPDVAGTSAEVLEKFKEINEAYEILSNQVKKSEYDRARKFYNYAKASAKSDEKKKEENFESNKRGFDFKSFFSQKSYESNIKNEMKTPENGEDVFSSVDITALEALEGTIKVVNMLQTKLCPFCKGRKFVNNSSCTHCGGKGEFSEYKKFRVKIPAGVKNKSKIRLTGEGEKGINGGKNGDLYLTINIIEVKANDTGLDVFKTIPITPFEAALGATISVKTPSGNVALKIEPGTQNRQKFRLTECGNMQKDKIGDMIVTVEIVIPTELSQEELSLYKKLKEVSSVNIRDLYNDR